jgi:hypothetical protein
MRSDLNDLANDLVARDHGKDRSAPFVARLVNVGMANAAIENIDQHIVGAWGAALEGKGRKRRGCRLRRIGRGFSVVFDSMTVSMTTPSIFEKRLEGTTPNLFSRSKLSSPLCEVTRSHHRPAVTNFKIRRHGCGNWQKKNACSA